MSAIAVGAALALTGAVLALTALRVLRRRDAVAAAVCLALSAVYFAAAYSSVQS